MYHSVGGSTEEVGADIYSVSVDEFKKQMEFVAKLGTVSIQGLAPRCARGESLEVNRGGFRTAPVITFDDGLLNDYKVAFPILKDLGLKAYFFILVSKIDTNGYMDWEQIRQLRDAGMVIGSHGMTHRILTELDDKELDYELSESKKLLEKNLGQPIDYLSIARGFHNKKIIDKVREIGYRAVFTSNPSDNDGFKFGRIPVRGNWSLEYFIRVLNNGLSFRDKTEELIKKSSKRILGAGYYDKIRTKILKK